MSYSFKTICKLTEVQYDGNDDFECDFEQLTTLEGCPEVVNGNFDCSYNKLTSLKGCPKFVNGDFCCSNNPTLEDISDLPVGVNALEIWDCPNIKVFPKHIKDTLEIWYPPKYVLERLKQQKHLEIIEESNDYIIVKEKPANEIFLEAV